MRTRIKWGRMAIFVLPFMIVGLALIIAGLNTDPTLMTDDGIMNRRLFFILMGGFFIVLTLLINGGIMLFSYRRGQRIQRLEQVGLHGTATVLQANDTGTYINNQPLIWMELQVEATGQNPYIVEKRQVVPYTKMSQVQTDSKISVLVDPDKPQTGKGVELLFK